MRSIILKFHSAQVYLENLPDDATFSIRLQTTLYSSVEFNQEPRFEDFPWIELRERDNTVSSADIVPLYTVETVFLSLQMFVEKES
ncbi:unnamed protein product [Phaedon cochleariae]|uniref:HORMA domain-containing protein n=1 Tax=Phaedon cochleariae TaxID=80249 RepID=A0A9N9SD66_PHACE|nr:unnamed protein product [Phaedon cochleariae]